MKKIALTFVFLFGVTLGSYACQAAYDNLTHEIDTFGHFDNMGSLLEAYNQWVAVSC